MTLVSSGMQSLGLDSLRVPAFEVPYFQGSLLLGSKKGCIFLKTMFSVISRKATQIVQTVFIP